MRGSTVSGSSFSSVRKCARRQARQEAIEIARGEFLSQAIADETRSVNALGEQLRICPRGSPADAARSLGVRRGGGCYGERMAGRFRQVRGHEEGIQLPLPTSLLECHAPSKAGLRPSGNQWQQLSGFLTNAKGTLATALLAARVFGAEPAPRRRAHA